MKKLSTLIAAVVISANMYAQAPARMSYQAVVRNAGNMLVTSAPISMRVSILQGSANGTAVYVETQTPTTNINGLATIEIGGGTALVGTFNGIDWTAGPYFIKTETDPTGGMNYSITGTSQMMSVPYAMYAKTSGSSTPGPQGPQGAKGDPGNAGAQGPAGTNGLTTSVNNVQQVNGNITLTKSNIGLGNVDNTADSLKPVSNAMQAKLDTKADLLSPSFLVAPTAPTPTAGSNSTRIATTAFVQNAISSSSTTATAGTMGQIRLAGDLAGAGSTASAPIISDTAITTVKMHDGAVTTAKIADDAITYSKIANNAIGATKIVDGQIITSKIAAKAVTSAKIDTSIALTGNPTAPTVTDGDNSTKIATTEFVGTAIANAATAGATPNATTSSLGKIMLAGDLTGSATAPVIADSAVTTAKIADGAVTSAKIADATITNTDISSSAAIAYSKLSIASGDIPTAKLATDAGITSDMIATGAVNTLKIGDGSIVTAKIWDEAVTSDKIADATIVSGDLANEAVTYGKIAALAIEGSNIQDQTIPGTKLQSNADFPGNPTTTTATSTDSSTKIATTAFVKRNLKNGLISAGTGNYGIVQLGGDLAGTGTTGAGPIISNNAITNVKILDGAVTSAKIADATITNTDISATADIIYSKLNLSNGDIPTAKLASDAGINSGMISTGAITNAKLNSAALQSIGALTTSIDKMIYTTGANTYATTDLSSTGRSFLALTSAGGQRNAMGLGSSNSPTFTNLTLSGNASADTVVADQVSAGTLVTSGTAMLGGNLTVASGGAVILGNSSISGNLTVTNKMKSSQLQVGNNGSTFVQMQSGTATIGEYAGNDGFVVITVEFPTAFGSAPRIMCTPRVENGQTYGDTYSVTTREITTTGFKVNVKRTDSNAPWGENLLMDWFAVQ